MNKGLIFLGVIGLVIIILVGSLIGTYNGLATSQQTVKSSWSQVESQMQRRADLIPNLVEVVKGYATHERETLTNLERAVAQFKGAATMPQMAQADKQMTMGMAGVIALAEKYPDLKADKHFSDLMAQIEGTENRITVARKDYNTAVESFNNKIVRFPSNIIANMSGYSEMEYFKADETAKTAPKIKF
jgi:LemA protein